MAIEVSNMKNIELDVTDNVLTIKIDLTQRFGESKSGKTIVVASTSGNIPVPGHPDVKIGVNAYTSK